MFSNPFASFARHLTCSQGRVSRKRRRRAETIRLPAASCQPLEARTLLAAATISTLGDAVNGDVSDISALQADDGGDGITLREAVEAANHTPGEDAIDLDPALAGSWITLGGSQLEVTDDLVITGPGADQLTVDADDQSRVLQIDAAASVELSGLTISGGLADGTVGGGIINFGTLAISNSIVTGNHADSDAGGIFNGIDASLTVSGTTISNNSSGDDGGGLRNEGTLTIDESIISDNTAVDEGGGLVNGGGDSMTTVTYSRISGNLSRGKGGGGIFNQGALSVNHSTINGNSVQSGGGGGIENFGGMVVVTDSTFDRNSATRFGGGILNNVFGTVTVTNSTISKNAANINGGGVSNFAGELTVTNSTIVLNRADADGDGDGIRFGIGGGISTTFRDYFSSPTLHNTVVAGNVRGALGADQPDDLSGARDVDPASAHNLVGDTGSSAGLTDGVDGNIVGVTLEQVLDPVLRDNGGPTLTHALLINSPAVDAGSNALAAGMTDQRGSGFSRISDGDLDGVATVDIGAFELQQPEVETLVENLLENVEDLGLSNGPENSLTARLDAVLSQLDADTGSDQSLSAKLESFIRSVEHWYSRGEVILADRDELIDDAETIILGLSLT